MKKITALFTFLGKTSLIKQRRGGGAKKKKEEEKRRDAEPQRRREEEEERKKQRYSIANFFTPSSLPYFSAFFFPSLLLCASAALRLCVFLRCFVYDFCMEDEHDLSRAGARARFGLMVTI